MQMIQIKVTSAAFSYLSGSYTASTARHILNKVGGEIVAEWQDDTCQPIPGLKPENFRPRLKK